MTYEEWKLRNNALKGYYSAERIKEYKDSICYFESGLILKDFDVVIGVLQQKICLTNPSVLCNFDFDKLNKRTDRVSKKQMTVTNQNKIETEKRQKLLNTQNLLYHGSKDGIKGKIRSDYNTVACDFGPGFYLGTMLEQAENRVCDYSTAKLYAFTLNLNGLKVYNFKDDVLWSLVIGYYRYNEKLHLDSYKKLMTEIQKIESNDVVVGLIADDKISYVYDDFMDGNITDRCLIESLKYVKYGKQVVLRTQKAVNNLTKVGEYNLTKDMRTKSINWNKENKDNMDAVLENFKKKYRRDGNYIDEIMEWSI